MKTNMREMLSIMDLQNMTNSDNKANILKNIPCSTKYFIITIFIIVLIIISLLSWTLYILNLKDYACRNLKLIYKNDKYKTTSFITINGDIKADALEKNNPINYFDNENSCLIKNYFILTAYNCCCGDGYKNNFVNKCALEKCIELGARCLDFEIYSYNAEPIVAASTENNNSIKETFNYLKLSDVFDILNNRAFNDKYTQCSYDPMFLHFRIMSENTVIYDKIGEYIDKHLNKENDYLLENKYNYKNPDKKEIYLQKLSTFKGKFIIMVNTLYNSTLDNSKLANHINIRSGSEYMKLFRYQEMIAAGMKNSLVLDDSKRGFVMVLPNINNKKNNFDAFLPLQNGCQFVGMKLQTLDNKLIGYLTQFKNYGGYSFILKPFKLRKDLIKPEPELDDTPIINSGPFKIGGTTD